MKLQEHFSILGQALFLALAAGCATSSSNYPVQLPSLIATGKTVDTPPVIAGRYADKGTAYAMDGKELGPISLTELLFRQDSPAHLIGRHPSLPGADTVMIVGPENDTLEIQSWQGSTQITLTRRFQYSPTDVGNYNVPLSWTFSVSLRDGGCIVLPIEFRFVDGLFGLAAGQTDMAVRKATDGSLIVRYSKVDGSIVSFVPLWAKDEAWYRFPPTADPAQANVSPRINNHTGLPDRSLANEEIKINTPALFHRDFKSIPLGYLHGNLLLTDSAVWFRQFENKSDELPFSVPFESLVEGECTVKKKKPFGWPYLYARTKTGEEYFVTVTQGPKESNQDRVRRLAAICEFIRIRISHSRSP